MSEHLLIESQGPGSGPGCARFIDDACALAAAGEPVCLLLVQDGVAAGVLDAVPELSRLIGHGGQLWVDEFSLRQRAIATDDLIPGTTAVGMDAVAAKLLEPASRVVWH